MPCWGGGGGVIFLRRMLSHASSSPTVKLKIQIFKLNKKVMLQSTYFVPTL